MTFQKQKEKHMSNIYACFLLIPLPFNQFVTCLTDKTFGLAFASVSPTTADYHCCYSNPLNSWPTLSST